MDDDMEDEVLYEVFATHACLAWRYVAFTTAGVAELVAGGGGESTTTTMLRPGPVLFVACAVVAAATLVVHGSEVVKRCFRRARLLAVGTATWNAGGPSGLLSTTVAGLQIPTGEDWEMREGLAGLYGMQGRRENMEDRYSVLQHVDVGEKAMSFFGVFDGHGGEYTAEYVKDNLFRNIIEKIKLLRSQAVNNQGKCKNGNNNVAKSNSKNSGGGTASSSEKKTEKKGSASSDKTKCSGREKRVSLSEEKPPKDSQINNAGTRETETSQKKLDRENGVLQNGVVELGHAENSKCEKETCSETLRRNSRIEDIPQSENSCPSESDVSMKKDDTYSTLNFVKRSSITISSGTNICKEKKEDTIPDLGYIDPYKNINYTRLLTDQIIAVDKQVVEKCKSRTDMSGTTALIAVLDGELLIIGNVGDSRAVMGDLKGSTIPLSFDHKPNQLKERRRIREAGGFITFTGVWRVAGILATSRALGDFPLKEPRKLVTAEPDVLTFSLRDHKAHFVIMATDGLWDVMSNEEAVAFVRDHIHEPDFGAKSLAVHAFFRGSQDNITVVILNIDKLSL